MEQQPEQRDTDPVRRKESRHGIAIDNLGIGIALGIALGAAFEEYTRKSEAEDAAV